MHLRDNRKNPFKSSDICEAGAVHEPPCLMKPMVSRGFFCIISLKRISDNSFFSPSLDGRDEREGDYKIKYKHYSPSFCFTHHLDGYRCQGEEASLCNAGGPLKKRIERITQEGHRDGL